MKFHTLCATHTCLNCVSYTPTADVCQCPVFALLTWGERAIKQNDNYEFWETEWHFCYECMTIVTPTAGFDTLCDWSLWFNSMNNETVLSWGFFKIVNVHVNVNVCSCMCLEERLAILIWLVKTFWGLIISCWFMLMPYSYGCDFYW